MEKVLHTWISQSHAHSCYLWRSGHETNMKQTTLILNNKIELKIESGTISCFGNVVLILIANVSLNLVLGMPGYKPKLQWRNIAASQTIRRDIELHYYKGICPQFQAMACQMKIQNNGRDTQLTEDYIRWNHILIFFLNRITYWTWICYHLDKS